VNNSVGGGGVVQAIGNNPVVLTHDFKPQNKTTKLNGISKSPVKVFEERSVPRLLEVLMRVAIKPATNNLNNHQRIT
jgi:hypothetical protein